MNPKDRPTEYTSALALLASLYGFLTQAAISQPAAALIALAVSFLPFVVSATVDAVRDRGLPHDRVTPEDLGDGYQGDL